MLAVCRVHQLVTDTGTIGISGIDKRPVDGPVRVGPYGLRADVQADRKHHGGLDKAVYAYAQEDADLWAERLGAPVPPGTFGENLRTVGIDVNDARIGEIWRVGDEVELQVTMPRTPCGTFARRVADLFEGTDARGWVRRFSDERRLGPYLRVLTGGRIRAGDAITVLQRPDGPSITDVYRAPRLAAAPASSTASGRASRA